MGTLKKIEEFILPHEVDFFKLLQEQSILTKNSIDELYNIYIDKKESAAGSLKNIIHLAEEERRKNLKQLYMVFITPVDKEAISRAFISLDWVVMSVKHLDVELGIYEIKDLDEYKIIFDLLRQAMSEVHVGFGMLHKNDFEKFSEIVFHIVHFDNEVIKEYARRVSTLLESTDIKKIITRKQILNQLKEISKRIRMCANDLEDMNFKMR